MAWNFLANLTGAGVGAIADGVGNLAIKIRQAFTGEMSPDDKAKIEAMLVELEMSSQMMKMKVKEMQSKIIVAEAKSGNFLAANWRPITMLVFVFIIFNNYILYPYLSLFWEAAPSLDVPEQMWALLKIGLGGYVVGRSAEKAVGNFGKGKNAIAQISVILNDDDLNAREQIRAIKRHLAANS